MKRLRPVQIHTAASISLDGACLDDLRRLVEETVHLPAGAPITLTDSSPKYIRIHHKENR